MGIKHVQRLYRIAGLLLGISLILSSCRQTPKTESIVNKEGQGSLVSNHAQADRGVTLREQLQAPEQTEAEGKPSNEFTSIHVNANVVIPDQTAVPIYSFVPRQFEEEELQTITERVFNDGGITNWSYELSQYSEEELYNNIERLQFALSIMTITDVDTPVLNEDGYVVECNQEYYNLVESMKSDYEQQLSEVRKVELNQTPAYSFSEYQDRRLAPMVIDGEEQPTDDTEAANWTDITVREFGARGRRNGVTSILRISEDLSNTVFEYHIDPNITMKNGGSYRDLDIRPTFHSGYGDNMCIYSLEEAEKMVTDFLRELGMDGFTAEYVYDLNVRNNMNGYDPLETMNGYSMILLRGYDGMNEIYDSYSGSEMIYREFIEEPMFWDKYPLLGLWGIEYQISEEYGKSTVNRYKEVCMATVMDDGIVQFVLINPMQEQEQLAEHVELLEFDQAFDCGIRQLEKKWGESGTSNMDYSRVDVRSIQLNYAYMQNPNAPNEYTMIPVWDFRTGVNGGVYVTINAIDGSAFERALMY